MTFGNWPENIHTSKDQEKRLASAKSAKTTPTSIDKQNETGIFPGSGSSPYQTTLDSCTCIDFIRRKLPCKHIYRLAIEVGKLNESIEKGINKNAEISLEEAVAELECLSDKAQIIVEGFLSESLHIRKTNFSILLNETCIELENCCLLKQLNSPATALQMFKRNQIIQMLDAHNITGFKRNLSLDKLIEWCIENLSDIWQVFPRVVVFCFIDQFKKSQRQVYSYLLRKYEWDSYFDGDMCAVKYPHGAIFEGVTIHISLDGTRKVEGNPNVCYFPDDKITKLLTQYGHNRCLEGYDVTDQIKK